MLPSVLTGVMFCCFLTGTDPCDGPVMSSVTHIESVSSCGLVCVLGNMQEIMPADVASEVYIRVCNIERQ